MQNLKASGIKLGIATGLPKILYELALKNNGIYDLFDAITSTDEVKHSKTFPDVFTLAIQKLGLEPQECFAFEDIPEGVKSAKQAGLTVYGIYDKYSESFKEDIKMIADGYLIDFSEAPNFRLRK